MSAPQRTPGPAAGDGDGARMIESVVARLLIGGTYVAIALVAIGVATMLAGGTDPLTHGRPPAFDLARIPANLAAFRPEGFLWAGLLVVLALPLGRVVVSGIGFLAAGDRRLALVSLLVLLVVCASVVVALWLGG